MAVATLLAALMLFQTRGGTPPGPAAAAPVARLREARASLQTAPPRLDGRLEDPAWRDGALLSDFVQREPREGLPGTERTEARVIYTRGAIYVAVQAFDQTPAAVVGAVSRRDEDIPSDWVGVIIDSDLDRRTAFEFSVNAAGVKRDLFRFNDTESDAGWDAVWDVAVHRDERGWSAEFRIPTSQLRFTGDRIERIGFNVFRQVHRKQETQYWAPVPRSGDGVVSRLGVVTGFGDLEPRRPFEVAPYLSSGQTFRPGDALNPFERGHSGSYAAGADFRLGLPANLTLTGAVNPDFGQVDADPAEVNLTAFESFFDERRPFFVEGTDLFRFNLTPWADQGEQLFYSRRIGRAPQLRPDDRGGWLATPSAARILAAGKLTGRFADGWRGGLLGAATQAQRLDGIAGDGAPFRSLAEPATSYAVGRVARDWRQGRSVLSLFGTGVHRSLDAASDQLRTDAVVVGGELSHRFAGDRFLLRTWLAGSRVSGSQDAMLRTQLAAARYLQRPGQGYGRIDSLATSLAGISAGISLRKAVGNWTGHVATFGRSPGFEVNDAGFMRWAGRMETTGSFGRRWLAPGALFHEASTRLGYWGQWSWGGERLDLGINGGVRGTLHNRWSGWIDFWRGFGGSDIEVLRGGPALRRTAGTWSGFGLETDPRRAVRGRIVGNVWADDEHDGAGFDLSPQLTWRPDPRYEFTIGPTFGVSTHAAWLLRPVTSVPGSHYYVSTLRSGTTRLTLRADAAFTRTLTLQAYAEPFVGTGEHREFRRVTAPGAARWKDQFSGYDPARILETSTGTGIDEDGDGAADVDLGRLDFTALSFRSNLVLRWEYSAGSTLFLVWQHGRSADRTEADFGWSGFRGLANAPRENVFMLKASYWLNLR